MEWGSRLNAAEHATLLDIQRTCDSASRETSDLQRMINLATQSQLLTEAATAFMPDLPNARIRKGSGT